MQRAPADDLVHDPKAFLSHSALSLDFALGMRNRAPGLPLDHQAFANRLGRWNQHWFVLVPDARRAKEGRPAYLLTPAVEKYVQAFGDSDDLLAPLSGHRDLPPVLPDQAYLASFYVPYLRGGTAGPDTSVGHSRIPKDAGKQGHGSEFVFTATMNGCAFAVTGDAQDKCFTAWHYQSPSALSNREPAKNFRRDRRPADWFGPEEYESPDQDGLFETTNMLWNGPAGWEVLSQETSVSAYDENDARIAAVRSRPLTMGPGQEAAYTARIYVGRAQTQLKEFMRSLAQARNAAGNTEQQRTLEQHVFKPLEITMAAEPLMLAGNTDFAALIGIAVRLKQQRAEALQKVKDWLAAHLEDATMTHEGGLLNRRISPEKLAHRRKKINILLGQFSDRAWIDGLLEEATDHPADRDGAPGAGAPAAGAGTPPA
ncbi:hypothetical protein [Streptomyces niger]|uniref:hypothetical protein n=1 Tax=Streptomyces niger TaxID=66373 RepID=UPI000B2865E3|nr:hypothetical protein [Streptomyces niger]